jgi:hypothetical protein
MSEPDPTESMVYDGEQEDEVLEFLKRAWNELRSLRKVRVWKDRFRIYDINGDSFEVLGIGYPDAGIVALLNTVNAAYRPELIHEPFSGPFKEFLTGKRYPWARDRIL